MPIMTNTQLEKLDQIEVQDTLLLRDIVDIAMAKVQSTYKRTCIQTLDVSDSGVCRLTTKISFQKQSGAQLSVTDTNNCVQETSLISRIVHNWLSFNLLRPSFTIYPICLKDDMGGKVNICQFGLCYLHYKDSSCPI